MVNIKAIVVIDGNNQVVVHQSWADMQQWDLSHASTQVGKTIVSNDIRESVRRARRLEDQYLLPKGSLEGIHLITGSSNELARKLHRPDIVKLLTSSTNIFVVKIKRGDPIIRTTIHTDGRIIEWEHFSSNATATVGRNVRFSDEASRTD